MTTQTVSSRVTLAAAALPRRAHAAAAGSSTLGARSRFVCTSCRQQQQQQQRTTRHRTPLGRRAFSSCAPKRQSASSQAPPPPPRAGYVRLTSRRLISLSGTDAPKFLQGILTASVFPNPNANRVGGGSGSSSNGAGNSQGLATTPGFYCGFLNATGRVLHDVFVYQDTGMLGGVGADDPSLAGPGSGGAFLIEVDATQVEALAKNLKRYMLRSKLKLRVLDEDECVAWHVWDDRADASGGTDLSTILAPSDKLVVGPVVLRDDRAPGLGYRVLGSGAGSGSPVPAPLQAAAGELGLEPVDDAAYRVRRYLLGVPEGQGEIPRGDALPLESNMDLMGGIDFRKGCYVGQELTIRTRHRGVVRKRILPCVLYGGGESAATTPPEAMEYVPGWTGPGEVAAEDVPHDLSIGREGKKGRSAGNWLAGVGNVGLALCRLQIMTDVQLPGDTAVAPFDPTNEFVMKWGAEVKEGGDKAEGEGVGEGKAVKIKAFVPEWLRTRLDESNASH